MILFLIYQINKKRAATLIRRNKMLTITISTTDNRVLNVNANELAEIIKIDGIEEIEVSDKNGWDYIENKMMEVGFNWDNEETVAENINRFMPLYESYLQKPSREEEFGRLINESGE